MKILAKFCFFSALVLSSWQVSAQASLPKKNDPQKPRRDGVARISGKMVEIKNGKTMPLSRTYKAENGTQVSAAGLVTFPDGRKEKLAEGYAVNKEGNKVIFEDDMLAPEKIRENQKEVTGKTETEVITTQKVKTIINDSTKRKAVRDTIRTTEVK